MSDKLTAIISEPFETPVGPGDDVSSGQSTKSICRITIVRGAEQFKSFTCDPTDAAIAQAFRENGYVKVGPQSGNQQQIKVVGERAIMWGVILCILLGLLFFGGCAAILG